MKVLFLLYGMSSVLITSFPKLLKAGFKDREQCVYWFFALWGLPGHKQHISTALLQLA